MKEPTPYRIVEQYTGVVKLLDGEESGAGMVRERVLSRTHTAPTLEDIEKLEAESRALSERAAVGYSRDFKTFESLGIEVQTLRKGRLPSLLSRMGLGQLIPYDSIESLHPRFSTESAQ